MYGLFGFCDDKKKRLETWWFEYACVAAAVCRKQILKLRKHTHTHTECHFIKAKWTVLIGSDIIASLKWADMNHVGLRQMKHKNNYTNQQFHVRSKWQINVIFSFCIMQICFFKYWKIAKSCIGMSPSRLTCVFCDVDKNAMLIYLYLYVYLYTLCN